MAGSQHNCGLETYVSVAMQKKEGYSSMMLGPFWIGIVEGWAVPTSESGQVCTNFWDRCEPTTPRLDEKASLRMLLVAIWEKI
jgi:hypothetical protein